MHIYSNTVVVCSAFLVITGACKAKETPKLEPQLTRSVVSADSMIVAQPVVAATSSIDVGAATPAVVVEDWPASATPQPLPVVQIRVPKRDIVVPVDSAKDFEVLVDVTNWDTGVGKNHVHLILDNYPYKAIYDTRKPVKLSDLLPPNAQLGEGQHVLTAFPSRATHESVKEKGAASFVTFWIGSRGTKPSFDAKKPHLIYSRPKGDNPGALGQNLLIDFYLLNSQLQQGEKVRFSLTGTTLKSSLEGEFKTWAPKVVRHLPKGEYQLKLELVDATGTSVASPFNSTIRKFTVDPQAQTNPALGASVEHGEHDSVLEHGDADTVQKHPRRIMHAPEQH